VTFDLNSVWSAEGAAAAALLIGYVLGVVQSLVPAIPSTGVARNWIIGVLAVGLVALAASQSGQTPAVGNVFGAALIALGIYSAATAAHIAGTASATSVSTSAKPLEP
jgi:hypothetical protein